MKHRALAADYDGTLAHDGRVDPPTLQALERARANGLKLLLVTGRELTDLSNTFPQFSIFDRIVAENGAVLLDPGRQELRLLASPPPTPFVERLTQLKIPLSVGRSIVATVEPHEHQVLEAIRDLGLEWHIIFNKGSVMALPAGVTKATGLMPALEELGVTADETVAVGDAENDQAFLAACGLAVAVANALPSLKAMADVVTNGECGAGVAELIDRLISNQAFSSRLDTARKRR